MRGHYRVGSYEMLHVHRNTVAYRLERIANQFGIDLEDIRVLGHVRLSFDLLVAEGTWRPTTG